MPFRKTRPTLVALVTAVTLSSCVIVPAFAEAGVDNGVLAEGSQPFAEQVQADGDGQASTMIDAVADAGAQPPQQPNVDEDCAESQPADIKVDVQASTPTSSDPTSTPVGGEVADQRRGDQRRRGG